MANLHPAVAGPPANDHADYHAEAAVAVERDLLNDLDQVLGSEKLGTADIPALLRDLAPDWAPYQRLTGTALRAILRTEYGITVPRAHNTWPLNPAIVRQRHRATRRRPRRRG